MIGVRITIDTGRLESYYERVMDEIYMAFHYHPLSFPTDPLSQRELSDMNRYTAEARGLYERGDIDGLRQVERRVKCDAGNNWKFAHLDNTSKRR